MPNYYVFLRFKNAGLFQNFKKTKAKQKDFIFGGKERKNRPCENYIEPVTVYQASNILHVLLGERPKPSMRESMIKSIPAIDRIAGEGYIKIDYYDDKNTETISTKKAVTDSYSNMDSLSWFRIKKYFSDISEERLQDFGITGTFFEYFVEKLTEILGEDVQDIPFEEIADEMYKLNGKPKVEELKDLLKKLNKTAVKNILEKGNNYMSQHNTTLLTINNGIDKVIRLNGEIIFKMPEEYILKLAEGKGVATLLDDGLVYIDDICHENEFQEYQLFGFKKINNISTKKINYETYSESFGK